MTRTQASFENRLRVIHNPTEPGRLAGANICLYFGELLRGKVLKFWGRVFGTQGLASKGAKISAIFSTFWKKRRKCIFA